MNTPKNKTMSVPRYIAIASAITLLSVPISPVWAIDTKTTGKKVTSTQGEITQQADINRQVKSVIDKLTLAFPEIKEYKNQKIDLTKRWSKLINVELSKNGAGNTPIVHIQLDRQTGELLYFGFFERTEYPKGTSVYTSLKGSEKQITDETAKQQAALLLEKLYGEKAKNSVPISIWREAKKEGEGKLIPAKTLPPVVNFRISLPNKKNLTTYVSVRFGENGRIESLDAVTKPILFDKWYAADLENRDMPNDELTKPAQAMFDRMHVLYPELRDYHVKEISLSTYNSFYDISFKRSKTDKKEEVRMQIDEETGKLVYMQFEKRPSGKGASPELAKQKAFDFLQRVQGGKVTSYTVGNIIMPGTNGVTLVILDGPAPEKEHYAFGVGADGKIYSFDG
ncbi:hypothetical protein SMD22_08625 [Brevibacillus halotolerans]|uniref:hypothetical protein n=1 Tax=Brevibacillus laterosporus TaxID=1465 RepID=UPI00215BD47A|nr:hypothetical protein [Brevibacillus laterosporus]MCR8994154.1 hypothetical protein [Brevibacillus laterosporus]WPS89005.1 hypothetical protein SMD22_08625 [Brevibacillus halotolerans]